MTEDELLRAGVIAAKAGDREKAASSFAQVVRINPRSEAGWFYLAMCTPTAQQREYCLRRVLELNPNNAQARQKLDAMFAAAPAKPSVSPFIMEEKASELPEPRPVSVVETAKSQVQPRSAAPKPRRRSSNALILVVIVVPILILVLAAGVFILLRAQQFQSPAGPGQNPIAASATSTLIAPSTTPSSIPSTPIPSPLPTVVYTAIYEEASCPFTQTFATASCGYLIVPEDRSGDPAHTIKLVVAVYHSTSSVPQPEPVIFLQGGPGAAADQLAADAYQFLVSPFLADRDFIVFDQRGTGLSQANLQCDELKKLYLHDVEGLIPPSTRELVYSNAFLSCSGTISASGVDLNAYTTVESAADINDLVKVLGYQKVDLYGASYGTRLALVVMRNYPGIVNSVILDSVVPVEANVFAKSPDSIQSGLQALFDSCAAEPRCAAAYPDLKNVFWDTINKLDATPVTLTTSHYPQGTLTQTVSGSTAMSIVLGSLHSTRFIDTAPQTIYRFSSGDFSTLIAAQDSLPFAFEDVSPGLYISMMCHEHILATSPEALAAISNSPGVKDFAWLPFYGDANDLFRTCKSWGAHGPLLGENDTVLSDIPTLIITGKFDPTTPPFFAQQVAAQLPHSYYFEFPNQGHTPTASDDSGCAMDIAIAFLNNPAVEPNRDCLAGLKPIDFLTPYKADPPIRLKTVDVFGITVDVPTGWLSFGDGFYFRDNSPLDITQIGILQVNVSADELKNSLSLSAYGYRGLDTAPFKVGDRQAHGHDWSIYVSTANGRPVDIAMADHGTTSLAVLMFSNLDEHEALYNTVFLPMVDSAR